MCRSRALQLFAGWLSSQVREGVLDCPNVELAALQFLGLIQEALVWPVVTRTPPPPLDPQEVIDSAVDMFLARYATGRARSGLRRPAHGL